MTAVSPATKSSDKIQSPLIEVSRSIVVSTDISMHIGPLTIYVSGADPMEAMIHYHM